MLPFCKAYCQVLQLLGEHADEADGAPRSKRKERRRAASLDGFGDIPRHNETALMQVHDCNQICAWSFSRHCL